MDFEKIVKFLTNELSEKEKNDFLLQVESEKKLEKEFNLVGKIWETSLSLNKYKSIELDAEWALVNSKMKPKFSQRSKKLPFAWMLYRAAVVLIIAAGLVFGLYKFGGILYKSEPVVLATGSENNEFILPDGSAVTLNKNSAIRYNKKFNKNNRELVFSGEACFTVAKNTALPFVIRTGNSTILVLGTVFNVKEDTCALHVTVVSGKVTLYETSNRKNNVQLIRNQKASFEYATRKIIYGENNDPNFLSWKTGRFEFFKTPALDVLNTIANYFDKKLILNINLRDSITGVFENQPLEEILKEIELTSALKIEQSQDYIIVRK